MSKKVLITGVCGETGSYLAEYCLSKGEIVIGIDNLFKGTLDNVANCLENDNFVLVIGDIRNFDVETTEYMYSQIIGNYPIEIMQHDKSYYVLLNDIDEVYNMAAVVETKYFYERPDLTYKVNCEGAIKVFDWSVNHRVSKFVNASSSEIYGHGPNDKWDEHKKSEYDSVEDSTRWSYAHGKILTEYYMNYFKDKIAVCHLRYSNCYGPRDLNPEHIIPLLMRSMITGESCSIYNNSEEYYRSFLYMSDAAEATYKAMQYTNIKNSGTSYNIGTSDPINISELYHKIKYALQSCKVNVKTKNILFNKKERPGDPKYRCLDCNRIKNVTGWNPAVDLNTGLSLMVLPMISHIVNNSNEYAISVKSDSISIDKKIIYQVTYNG